MAEYHGGKDIVDINPKRETFPGSSRCSLYRLKFEIPLYSDSSSVTNDAMKKTLPLLRHTAALLKQGNSEGALYDDWINKSPIGVTAIYEDILLRIQVVQL
jgi:hypothetical protein